MYVLYVPRTIRALDSASVKNLQLDYHLCCSPSVTGEFMQSSELQKARKGPTCTSTMYMYIHSYIRSYTRTQF